MSDAKRRTYSPEIRSQALSMLEAGKGVGEVSRALDVPRSTLRGWRDRSATSPKPKDAKGRNADGTFQPGHNLSTGQSTAVQRARARAQDLSEDVVERLYNTLLRAEEEHIADSSSPAHGYLVLSVGRELLDRALGKPKQTQEITERTKFSIEDLAAADSEAARILAKFEDEEGA